MDFDKISPRSMEYLAKIAESPEQFKELTLQYIATREADNLIVPDFDVKYEWLNVSDRLSFKNNLSKKLVVLDFFTYCCINCMHILPQLHDLEQKHSIEDGVVVIGVHSAKFQNEKVLDNVLQAVMRYDIRHPVVNDADADLWTGMSIRCWPTFVIVSPDGHPLLYLVGEGHRDVLFNFVELALDYYGKKGLISDHSLPVQIKATFPQQQTSHSDGSDVIKFPGKIAVNQDDCNLIAVSDTGHNRVLVFNESGIVSNVIGTGMAGLKDGNFDAAELNSPQGLAWCNRCLYIADTNNHVIRKADLDAGTLVTIVGTGKQGVDKEGGKEGTEQEIASPWDVVVTSSPGADQDDANKEKNCLYIACAGTHQIWCYFLEDGSWLKKGSQKQGTCLRFAGSGDEQNRNNSYPHKASFAQPSHLSVGKAKDQPTIFVADSESSSVRIVDLKTGAVKACVGGERDPMNLFAYGDADGKSVDAKLQHPLAVQYNSHNGLVYVADSYNHKIKVIDPSKNTCTTLTTKGGSTYKDGSFNECQFNEPGGLAVCHGGTALYIADTNNHKIRKMDLEERKVETLTLILNDDVDSPPPPAKEPYKELVKGKGMECIQLEPLSRDLSCSKIDVSLDIVLCDALHFTEGAPSKWLISYKPAHSEKVACFTQGDLNNQKFNVFTKLSTNSILADIVIKVETILYVCIGEMCFMKQYLIQQLIRHDSNAGNDVINIKQQVQHKE